MISLADLEDKPVYEDMGIADTTKVWNENDATTEASAQNVTERVSWWIKALHSIQKLGR